MTPLLNADMIDRFRRDGFLPFDTGIQAPEIAALRRSLMYLHQNQVGFEEGALFDAIGPDDGSVPARFQQILHPRAFAPELTESPFFQIAHDIAKQLLGPNVRFKADISLLKPAMVGAATPWHQDEAFQDPAFAYNEVSFWLALQPVDAVNSCMAYVPGSHLGPVLPHGFPDSDSRIHALECTEGFDPRDAVACPLPTGGCVIHNGRTVHGAGPNISDQARLAYVLIFDLVPTPSSTVRHFPWREKHRTARAQRELEWRRRGGLLVHLWRQRSRVKATSMRTLLFDLRQMVHALRRMMLSTQ